MLYGYVCLYVWVCNEGFNVLQRQCVIFKKVSITFKFSKLVTFIAQMAPEWIH